MKKIAQSEFVAEPTETNGASTTMTMTCEAHVAGNIDTSRRCRVTTITTAKDAVITNGSSTARGPALSEPATITVMPTAATPIESQVRRPMRSEMINHPSSAANIGAAAWKKSTFATEV